MVNKEIERIISLVPSVTEILYSLNLDSKLVGVTEHCNYPQEAVLKEKVGPFGKPDIYKILKLKPDLVLGEKRLHAPILKELKSKVKIKAYSPSSIKDILDMIEEIGNLCDSENTSVFINSLKNRISKLKIPNKKKRVFFLMSTNPFYTPGKDSYQYDALKLAGGNPMEFTNIVSYEKLELKDIIDFDPEIIIFCGVEKGKKPLPKCKDCLSKKPICLRSLDDIKGIGLEETTAFKNNKIYPISCDMICKPGERLISGIEKLNKYFIDNK